jgi:hypothetical protein
MALQIKQNGKAVVEESANAAENQAVATAEKNAPASGAVNTNTADTNKSAAPDNNAASGLDYATIQNNLNTPYDNRYEEQLADLYNQITQRKPFSYSTEDDMLYKMYEEKYTQQGKQAMRDSMGQAAALTGGYGSSYGQAVGQQQYDAHLAQLNDILPTLYQMAYSRYQDEGNKLEKEYAMLSDKEAADYSRWLTNRQLSSDDYNRLMEQAALRGTAGDFSGYEEVLGAETAGKMQTTYNLDQLLSLIGTGLISNEQINQLLGPYLASMGISTMPTTGGATVDYYREPEGPTDNTDNSGVGYTGVAYDANGNPYKVTYNDYADAYASLKPLKK